MILCIPPMNKVLCCAMFSDKMIGKICHHLEQKCREMDRWDWSRVNPPALWQTTEENRGCCIFSLTPMLVP